MTFLELNSKIAPIKCFDPLGGLLGSFEGGTVEYDFLYAVKLAGHGCPTVLTSFLAADRIAKALYPDSLPIRGDVKIQMQGDKQDGVIGVIASVFSAIFGASDEGGFKGLGGVYARNSRLFFDSKIDNFAKFTRLDNGCFATLDFNFAPIQKIPAPDISSALAKFQNGTDISDFQSKWLEKLWIIADSFDSLGVVKISTVDKK